MTAGIACAQRATSRRSTYRDRQAHEPARYIELCPRDRTSLDLTTTVGDVDVQCVDLVVVRPADRAFVSQRIYRTAGELPRQIQDLDAHDLTKVGQVEDALEFHESRRLSVDNPNVQDVVSDLGKGSELGHGMPLRTLMIFPVVSLCTTVTSLTGS